VTAVPWSAFAAAEPALAARGTLRLHGRVSYLATSRRDGSPRVHPVTPIVAPGELYVFMEPTSPKGHDLKRDARYALHAGVEDTNGGDGGEFIVSGAARLVNSLEERARAAAASSYKPADRYILFALTVSEAAATTYGDAGPVRLSWKASGAPAR
jgi:nitroimidazol reductase NimA-like FMN-containing flavoprotein (pyridoxamine 5'-phosphate oxidase superfamily)